jgi:hypothetical protein
VAGCGLLLNLPLLLLLHHSSLTTSWGCSSASPALVTCLWHKTWFNAAAAAEGPDVLYSNVDAAGSYSKWLSSNTKRNFEGRAALLSADRDTEL